ncbi:flagellar basal body rod protein FlgC [Acidisoma silvae]|uniref:Flagellar basal-body rod protein FlgC n=1 Tax=Acidisoma silvae TaxID=2802396 RepID=A0A963YQ86_9PROT|nr:flagellar basal body rod protein FlgC [Acidisoma silvae]MCB8874909.1 flagellar basal body rod protein FlgC [Acidisoma silvae]
MADVFAITGSAMNAQNARLSTIASNLANANSIAAPGDAPYRAHEVVFQAGPVDASDTEPGDDADPAGQVASLGVNIVGTVLSNAPPVQTYDPSSPYADAQGYVTGSNVSQVGQMVDLINASNSYSASVAVPQQATRVDQQMISAFQVS